MKFDQLKDIPFFDHRQINSHRVIPSLFFYESGSWHSWISTQDGLLKIKAIPGEGTYFSKLPEHEDDIYLEFFNFLGQRVLRKEILYPVNGIRNDIMNICASLRKLSLLYEFSNNKSFEVSRMVITELEYLIGVCRSIFDLLQEIIAALWKTVVLTDESVVKKNLHKSFRKMVIENEQILEQAVIKDRFAIPEALAQFYCEYAEFFQILRKFRDNIAHHGSSLDYIFLTRRGFAVKDTAKPFSLFNVWNEEHKLPNSLASLRVPVAYMIRKTLGACEDFALSIQKFIRFPDELAPDYKLFFKMSYSSELLNLDRIIQNSLWFDEL
ncbi:hypothetical protein AB3N61_18275 [Leptospira sp. WS58.C1]|uniref:hypothetical protein n=1 Tax=Leptospira cinconiae TaxID=3235173 RepID=UPI00349EB7E6